MIRITGVLAVVATVALLMVLIGRTNRAEFVGPISAPPAGLKAGQPAYTPAPPGTRPVWVVTQRELTAQEMECLVMAGINMTGMGESEGTGPMTTHWGFQIPDAAAKASQIGDELVIRARSLYLPGIRGPSATHVRYELRHGVEVQSFGEETNAEFTLVWGLIAAAPLLLWGVAAVVVTLCSLTDKAPRPV